MKWRVLLLAAFLSVGSAWSLSLSDLITRSRLYLKDTSSIANRQTFTDSQITAFLNDGQSEVNARTWTVVNSTPISILSGTTEYILPPDFVVPLRVSFNNRAIPERTLSFLDDANTNWVNDTGTPREFYVRIDSPNFTVANREVVGIHPVSTMSAVLLVQYLAQPTSLSAGGDVPFNGAVRTTPYHQILAYYAAYRGYLTLGDKEDASTFLRDFQELLYVMESNDRSRVYYNPNFRGLTAMPPAPK